MFKRRLPSLVTLFGLAALQAQSPSSFSRITVDQNTSTYDTDEKTMLNVLGRSGELDLVIGRNPGNTSGLVWYEEPSGGPASGSWAKHVIDSAGGFYEGMATMDVNHDGVPDIVASRKTSSGNQLVAYLNPRKTSSGNQLVAYLNPRGFGKDPRATWQRIVINPNEGTHAIQIADMDGDGNLDIIASGAGMLGGKQAFISFWNGVTSGTNVSWTNVEVADVKEGVAVLKVPGSNNNHLAGVADDGNLYWFANPKDTGGSARKPHWFSHYIGAADKGCSIAAGYLSSTNHMDVVVMSNENNWGGGILRFSPTSNINAAWNKSTIDSGYRAIHQGNVYDVNGDGKNDLIVGEQWQAGHTWEGNRPLHPSLTQSRLTVFYGNGSGGFTPSVLATDGMQNQVVGEMSGHTAICGANHGHYYADGEKNPVVCFYERRHQGAD